jgi:hypothetical protein
MKTRFVVALVLMFTVLACLSAWEKVTKKVIQTNVSGLECIEEKTTTDSDDWVKDGIVLRFRTTNGKSCDISFNMSECSFTNCKPVYTKCFVNGNDNDWSMGFLSIEAKDHNAWSCEYSLNIKWRK